MSNFTRWLSFDSPSRLLLPPNNLRDSLVSLFSVQGKRSHRILSVAFAVLMAVFLSQSSFAQELLVNPGFESKFTGWQPNPGKTVMATNPVHSGTYAAHINNSTVGDEYFYQNVNATASAKYSFSVWAMVHDASKYSSVGVNVYDVNWVKIPAACVEIEVNATSFTQYTKSFTVPANAKYLQVFGYTNLAILKVDDYSLTQICNNVTSGGTIAANQTGCSGFDPAAFTSAADPSGGSADPLEIVWLKSTTATTLTTTNASQWTTINGATGLTYNSGPLTQTTSFIRCSRRAGCTDYVGESNVLTVTISGACCSNVTSGGTIAAAQSGCSGFDPAAFTSVTDPSGGTGTLEYVWLKSTTATTLTSTNQNEWIAITGATASTYDAGPLTKTTAFIRCSRRSGCSDYVGESNIIIVTINANCGGKDPVCISRKTPILNNVLCGTTTNYGLFFEDLKGNVASPATNYSVKSGELTEFCDGTAVLNYTACVNGGGANDCITVNLNLSGRTGTPPANSPVTNTHCTGYTPSVSDWYYYPTSNGTFTGTGIYAGLAGTYTQNMGALQIGTGGGLNEISKFGASSWFFINITSGGTNNWSTVSKKGDINVNLGASTNIASVTAKANPTSICKGESVALTATLDANSKSANCSPTYSWVGSNGFTSNQATVTNTNVQGATTYTVTVTFTAANGSKCSVTATTGVALNAVCCDNVTNGGQIAASQSGCAPFDPAPFTEVAAPSGGSGAAEFLWLKSTTTTVFTSANSTTDWFQVIGANGATLDVGPLSKTTAYIRCSRRAGCSDYVGESNVIIITVNPTPAAPTVTGATFCGTSTATLTATCATGSTPNWYTALTGGSAVATGTSYTTPSISSATSYYVTCKSTAGCESTPRTEVKATVNPNPNAPAVTPATSCGPGSVTLGAVCGTGSTANWYAAATGGSSIATGANYTTVSLSASTTYYVSCKTDLGCESPRVAVKATVIAKITDGGKIQSNEDICPGKTPALITSVTPASGGDASLAIEYIWLQTTSLTNGVCPQNIVGQTLYTQIPGATSTDYQPGAITQTTCYIRCARRAGCTDYIGGESNIVKKTLLTSCQGKDPVCLSRKTPVLNTLECNSAVNYGLWFSDLKGNVPTPAQTYSVKSGEFTEFCDGTAVLSYVACVNGGGANDCITTTVNFSGRTGTPPAGSPVSNTHCSNYMPNVSDWYYYPVSNGTFSGTGIYAGLAGTYAQNMAAFQVGTGGGLNEITKFGGSSWFKITITNGGTNNWTTASKDGDININLGSSTTIASVTATATPTAICSGENVNLTATVDAASKSANCSPSYSWVGSNGFTSTQATVTNTNVTASTTYTVTVTFTAANGSKCSVTATTGVTVNPTPATPTVTPAAICGTGTVTLGATCATGATAQWYTSATGGTVIATGPSYTTPSISATTPYYVSCKSPEGCLSARVEVKATVNANGVTPTVKPAAICGTGTVTLGATCSTGSTAQWYTAATGGTVIATGSSYTTPSISSTTTYYVSCKTPEGCESARAEVKATVNPIPAIPTVTPALTCGTGSVTLGAVCATGSTVQWYAAATGGSTLTTGSSYITPTLSTTTSYYVSCKTPESCESARVEVKATVIAKITDGGTIKADEIICVGTTPSKIVNVTLPSGGDANLAIEYLWLKTTSLTATGTCPQNIVGQNLYTPIPGANSSEYQPGAITQTTCYIRCSRRTGCTDYDGESNVIKKTTEAYPVAPTVTPAAICGTGTVTLGATCTNGSTAQWYTTATGGTVVATGASYTTPSISATTTYYVLCKSVNAGCESGRTPVTATINPIPAAPTVKGDAICGTGTVTLGATCTTGVAQWYAAATGGSSVATGASYTTPSISSTTSYYVSCKTQEGCESGRTPVTATINPIPAAPTVKGDAICGTGTVTLGATCTTGTAQWYAAATGGSSIATGASYTTPSISSTTSYYVSCKTTEGCESGRIPVTATINPIPAAPAVKGDAICGTGTVTLGATCTTGTAQWYAAATGGSSIASGASYTTPSISATTSYYVSCKTTEGCESGRTPVTATINPIPAAPTVKGDAICGTGTVTLGATCTTGAAQWYAAATGGSSIATGASYTTSSISATTSYYVSCKTTEGCESGRTPVTATINPIPAAPTVKGDAICGTGTVTLGATCTTGVAQWYAAATGGSSVATGASYTTPSISSTTSYYVSCKTTEGCESGRTTVTATINPIPAAPTVKGDAICGTGTVTLGATCTSGTAQWYAATTGGSSIATGASYTTPSISSTTAYYVSCKTQEGCESGRTTVTATINTIPAAPTVKGDAICGTGTVTLGATCTSGTAQWYAAATGGVAIATGASYTTPSISATTSYYVSCKTTEGCESGRTTVTATINPIPAAPTVKGDAICGTGTVTLGATCTSGTAQWYAAATGGSSIATGASYTTPSISSTTSYYVSCKTTEGCESGRTPVTATINPIPAAPTVKGDAICGTGTVTLGATCTSGTAQWYAAATGGAAIATGASYTTPSISSTTSYYVSCKTTEGCESGRTTVTATINPIPAAPTVKGDAICGTGTVTLGATCTTGTAQWYAAATGGSAIATGASYTTPSISTTTSYYVSCKTTEGCESGRTTVTATINPIPNAPTVKGDAICGTGTVTLGATCTSGTAQWYAAATGGSAIATGASYTTPSISSTTSYYVSCKTTEGCESGRTTVTATINPIPAAPTVKGDAICGTGTVTLGATCTSGTAQWYAAATGGSAIATGASYTTPSISATTSYYVSCKTTEGCESGRTTVTATINPIPAAPTVKGDAICGTGTVTLGATCTSGVAQWYAAATGGSAIATGASYTTPSISSTTSYYVSCKTTEGCESGRTTVTATINPIPAAPTVKGDAICGTGTVTLGATCTSGTAQWYAAATGGAAIATGASYTTPSISSTTSYYVSCKTTEGCESGRTTVTATINPIPAAPTVKGDAICGTGTVTLGATCTSGTAQWYAAATGGSAIATGASYTTPSISATTSYYVSCKTTEGCESGRTAVTATINPIPNAPTVKGAAICGTGTVTLGATCTTGVAQWYAAATGGSAIATGALYTTPSISSTTSYYVSCKTTEGCESGRTPVTATINPIPVAPTVKGDAICGTGTVTLGATCTSGTAQWYAAATGGVAIATGASYTTPSISATTSYYVSCKTTEGCESGRTTVTATINPIPAAPTVKGDAICGTGTVTLGATCTSGTAQWYAAATGGVAIATGASYTTPSISSTTSYYVSCKTTEGCESGRTTVTATINPIPAAPTVKGDAICGTGTVTLGATCTSGTAQWYAAATGGSAIATGASYTTPSISATTSYYVSCKTQEGCESGRTTVTATINPIPAAPTVKGDAICGTGTVTLGATCTSGTAQWYAAATGGAAIATGASYTTPSISATTSYYVSCKTTEGCESGRTTVTATINPIPAAPTVKGDAICGTGTVTLGATCTSGTAQWYAAATGGSAIATGASYTTPSISATTSYYVSCKTTEGCESGRTTVTATINPIPAAPTVKGDAICGTGTVTLGATCTSGTAQWYAAATGGSAIATGASYTTPSISATTSYYVSCKTTEGCESGRITVTATINPIPAAPTVKGDAICGTGTVTLGATCTSGTAQWYTAATGGSAVATGASHTTPSISATTSYYVSCKTTEGCESGRTTVTATVNANPVAPTVTPATNCGSGSVTLGATCSSGTPTWYSTATGGSSIASGASYTTPTLSATTSYYVSCKSSAGCESARTEVKATIIGKITDGGTIKADEIICVGAIPSKITSVTPASGGDASLAIEYIWLKTTSLTATGTCPANIAGQNLYTVIPGATSTEYQPGAITQTTCYIRCARRVGCTDYEGESNAVKKSTEATAAAPTVTPAAICGTGTVTLGATCTTGTANWYAAATGGTAIATGASFTTPSISATTSYYVSCKSANAGCESARVEVKATINPIPATPTVKGDAICGTGTVTLGATCTTGTAQWYAAATGGSIIATGASYTTPSISATTSYYVSCKSAEGCESGRTEVKATVNANASAPTVTPAAICGTGTVTLGATCTTGTATWYAAATGGSSIATGATFTTASISATTSYYVSCKSSAGCESARVEVKATINAIPAAPSVTPAAICGTGTVTLGATCTTGTAQWYAAATGGSVIATGASYTTPSISATTSYYVSCKSAEGCESGRTEVKATINAGGTAPTVTPATSCGNGSVTLGATCITGVAQWYAAATGGTAIATGASYVTPTLSATTSYYVSCKSSAGCESARTEVKATIIAKITDGGTIKADETICGSGTPAKITSVTLPSGGSANVAIEYIWLKTTSLTSTGSCPANIAGQNLYTVIPGSTSAEYQPGAITQTTCYIRCSRRAGCTDYDGESNTVKKTITNPFTVTATANPASTCAGGTVNITTTTTATGTVTYTWKGPDGFTASTKDVTLANVTLAKGGVYTVTVSNGSCSAVGTVQVTVTNCLKLGDTVFNDKNNNGKQDAGEPNIPGVTVNLYNSANTLVATTTTDPVTGKYLFSNLAPGDYTVEIVAPAGYKSSTGTNGSATGAYEPAGSPNNNVDGDDNGTTVSGQTIRSLPVTLTTVGGDNLTVDFGLFKPASIGDYVFRDLNGDGKQDAGEGGVNGVKVNLYDSANNLVATATTGPDGKYLFDNLIAGNYTVEFVKSTLASGFNFSPAGTTTPDKDSDANVTTGKTGTITLTEGQNRTDIDAGVTTPCDNDKTPPVMTACPSDILIKTRGTYAYASWTAPTATDNCGTPIVTTTNESGSAFPVGSTTVTYTATDAKGNKVTCSFVVNVVKIITCDVDTQAPVFYDCPTDITVVASGSSAVVYWDHPAVGDNCGIPSIVYNYEPGASFPVGVTIVKYTAKDAKGNTSYCTFKITVTNRGARTAAVAAANPEKVASEADVNVENHVNIYPNPSNTDFAIELSADLMKANTAVEVNIIGMTGNSHFSQTAVGKEAVSVKVPVESMQSGTYFVNVGLDNGRMIIKKLQIIK